MDRIARITFIWYAAALAGVCRVPLLIRTARGAIESVDKNIIQGSFALGLIRISNRRCAASAGDLRQRWQRGLVLMVIALTVISSVALYLANKYGKDC